MAHFIHSGVVEFAHTDMAGIVHFSEYYKYFESAESAFFRSQGLSLMDTFDGGRLQWPRVFSSFDFISPMTFGDEFALHLSVLRVGTTSVTLGAEVFCGERKTAEGKTVIVCVEQAEDGRMAKHPIPEQILNALKELKS